ncbi:MAG: hypothetical protein QOF51_2604 [Chloroflexota bacterium]|jgi:hypothetical protein|nr:hypothetical protein [Chloroflexota bacterium]
MLATEPRPRRDPEDDLSAGQIVILAARWLLILTSLVITLWGPGQADLDKVRITIFVVLGLAAANFYLHAQLLMGRPVASRIVYGASAVDILVITALSWTYAGLAASVFVFYFPALIAFSVVFPRPVTFSFTAGLLALYAAVCAVGLRTDDDLRVLVARLLAIAAVAVVGNMYRDVEHDRREATQMRQRPQATTRRTNRPAPRPAARPEPVDVSTGSGRRTASFEGPHPNEDAMGTRAFGTP